MRETQVQSLSPEDPLEKELTIRSSILAWKIPSKTRGAWQAAVHGVPKELDMAEGVHFHFHFLAQTVKCLSIIRETWVQSLGREGLLEKEMATHSSILAWKMPWTEEPDRLQSMGPQRVGHDWATSLSLSLWWLNNSIIKASFLFVHSFHSFRLLALILWF